ncbi:cation-translocating P-type ATPase [Aquibacillus sp. 3ASR75-11]|uniref:Probable copper-transporting ATPase SynA n=1 Tax=Terrihalobacillus insolitus TaxID=2950438 RepID=A0A9X3WWZ2_9BACI|nr:cation-translocating P-type ATPase [Terrihalobacillus insolitus]MDC3426063.1 cation-translocating P-type ATPase [Terrihalobacillus insolitus]
MTNTNEKFHTKIGGMSCSFCTGSIQKAILKMDGVQSVNVSLSHEEALIQYESNKVKSDQLIKTIKSLGYTVRDPEKLKTFEEEAAEVRKEKNRLFLSAGFAATTFGLMVAMWFDVMFPWFKWVAMTLALVTVFGTGWYILKMAFASLRRGILNQHVLLEFGAFGGLLGGFLGFFLPGFPILDFFAVATFITTYHILSGYVSKLVRTRSSQAVRKLMDLQPDTARVIRNGEEVEAAIDEVQIAEHVRVRPGDRVPLDGKVFKGESSVDESLVTGESIPVEKGIGAEVIGGSINQSGTLVFEVTKIGSESFLQQIVRHVEEARALKPNIIQLLDLVLKYYVPGVLGFAGLAILTWTFGAWLMNGDLNGSRSIFATLAVLVMGYPCALGMAGPLAMIRGGGLAAEQGILMRSGEAFEIFKDIKKVVLDKTGTITKGEPEVVHVLALSGYNQNEVLQWAGSAESVSEHPLAQAIVNQALDENIELEDVEKFESITGHGIVAKIGEDMIRIGSPRYLEEQGIDFSEKQKEKEDLELQGRTVVGVARNDKAIGFIAIADTLKEDAKEAITRMKEAGLEPIMITGDNVRTARAVAKQVGIDRVMAQVLPNDKAENVRKLQQEGYKVAMVGDGINDAPALMQADIGIAIGAGTDIAIESSDVILTGNRLGGMMDAYRIGKVSYRKTVQNLILAFTFNGVGVPLAVTGWVHPVWAMIAMVLSVTTVLVNSFGGKVLSGSKDTKTKKAS